MSWVQEHLALVIILVAIVVTLLIGILIWYLRRKNATGYERLEMDLNDYLSGQRPEDQKRIEQEQAEMNARFFLRSFPNYEFNRALPEIGSRKGKHYFLVRQKNEKRENRDQMMCLFYRGENCVFPFTDGTRKIVNGILARIKHPFVHPTILSDVDQHTTLIAVLQPFRGLGSLKDQIFRSDPQEAYTKKYQLAGKPLNERTIATFGRQILEGLYYFEKVGYPYGQLSAANVIVEDGACKLAGYENSLFGLAHPNTETVFAPLLQQYRKANKNRKLLNVLQFGHVIFEMAMGHSLESATPTYQLSRCSRKVVDVLDFIFGKQPIPERPQASDPDSAEACPFPTVNELVNHPFFAEASVKIKKSDLTFEPEAFDEEMDELLAGIKNRKKLTSTDTAKSKKSKRSSSVKSLSIQQSSSSFVPTTPAPAAPATPVAPTPAPAPAAPAPAPSSRPTSQVLAPPPPAPPAVPPPATSGSGRGALLSSITGFKGGLKKVKTNDRSKPVL